VQLIRFLLRYSPRALLLALAAGIVSGACNTAMIALINSTLKNGSFLQTTTILSFLGLLLLLPISRFLSEWLLARLGQGALLEMRIRLSRKVLGAPLKYLEKLGAHRVLTMLTDDIPAISGALVIIPLICINFVIFIGGLIYLCWLSPILLVIVLGTLALGIFSYQFALIKAMNPARRMREVANELFHHFKALTEGTKELKLHYRRRLDFLNRTLTPAAESYRHHTMQSSSILAAAASWGQAFIFVIIGLILALSQNILVVQPEVLTGYVLVLIFLMSPLQFIMNTMPALARANVAVANMDRFGLDLSHNLETQTTEPEQPGTAWEPLVLSGVEYTYYPEGDDNPFTLGPLDLTFYQGELVFVLGGNGSGKTTLAKLLTGLYLPESGQIYLNHQLIDEQSIEWYRQHFSAVFSDFYLFKNFPGLDGGELEPAATEFLTRLELAHKVKFNEGRLSTLELSQGQRKRLALLTAYLEDRPIYIFDEWAADQDPYFREVFYEQLLPELKARGKTVVVITHDDRYFHLADRLIKLDYGRVVTDLGVSAVEK
jgi:putative ATP-binding cassette transporter